MEEISEIYGGILLSYSYLFSMSKTLFPPAALATGREGSFSSPNFPPFYIHSYVDEKLENLGDDDIQLGLLGKKL